MVSRSGWYYEAEPEAAENLRLMRLIDEQYTRTPFYGIRRMGWWLGEQGYAVNAKRVRRLMRQMGLEALYPKPRLSDPGLGQKIYPYRLRNLKIERPDHVWASDITYIRLRQGFVYLVAIMDWFSRYVLAWEVSISLESAFCVAALDWALTDNKLFASNATGLLATGAVIWATNVIAFGQWYWDLDRGGAAARAHQPYANPAFVFPEMLHTEYVPATWVPEFADYLSLAFWTATAFSSHPTSPRSSGGPNC